MPDPEGNGTGRQLTRLGRPPGDRSQGDAQLSMVWGLVGLPPDQWSDWAKTDDGCNGDTPDSAIPGNLVTLMASVN